MHRMLVEIRCLLHHVSVLATVCWVCVAPCFAHGVPLQLVKTSCDALDLNWQLDSALI